MKKRILCLAVVIALFAGFVVPASAEEPALISEATLVLDNNGQDIEFGVTNIYDVYFFLDNAEFADTYGVQHFVAYFFVLNEGTLTMLEETMPVPSEGGIATYGGAVGFKWGGIGIMSSPEYNFIGVNSAEGLLEIGEWSRGEARPLSELFVVPASTGFVVADMIEELIILNTEPVEIIEKFTYGEYFSGKAFTVETGAILTVERVEKGVFVTLHDADNFTPFSQDSIIMGIGVSGSSYVFEIPGNYILEVRGSDAEGLWGRGYFFKVIADASTQSSKPSSWAEAEVSAAIAAELVPTGLQGNYQGDVSRGDVAAMFINLIEKVCDQTIDEFIAAKGVEINDGAFTDTTDRAVLAANALGIINGVGEGLFDPGGTLKRAQIAAIINRAARALDINTEGYPHSFIDVEDHWSDAELGWPASLGIINGYEDGTFRPEGNLTTEQAIAITYRAFSVLTQDGAES